jgi:hypothetical protein
MANLDSFISEFQESAFPALTPREIEPGLQTRHHEKPVSHWFGG